MKLLSHILLLALFGPDVRDLEADDFAVRQAAEARLTRWADVCWPLLNRPFAHPERRRRARRVLAHVVPERCPPIALLSGRAQPEWHFAGDPEADTWATRQRIGDRPGIEWHLAYLLPDPHDPPALRGLIWLYHQRSRSEFTWKDWHSDADGRAATRLLVRDLLALGVPAPAIRTLVGWMRAREQALQGGAP